MRSTAEIATPVRVLMTVPFGDVGGGAETMLLTLLEQLDPAAVDLEVVLLAPGPLASRLTGLGYPTEVIRAGRVRHPRDFAHVLLELRRRVGRSQPDAVLSWMAKAHLYTAPALAGMTAQRVGWWQHGVPLDDPLDRIVTRLPASIVFCSSCAGAEAQRALRPTRRTKVIHPGHAPPDERPSDGRDVRSDAKLPTDAFVVGLVGRFQPDKGQLEFVEAVAMLRDTHGILVRGLLVGESEVALSPGYGQLVRNAIRTYKLKGAIHLTGQVADARPYIRAMDVLVNPSEREGFGLTLIEAMSEGVPVIAVRAGGPAEIVEHEHTGFLIARRDTTMLAEALVVLHRDSGLRERLATAATDVAASRFSGAAMARRFEAAMRAWVAG